MPRGHRDTVFWGLGLGGFDIYHIKAAQLGDERSQSLPVAASHFFPPVTGSPSLQN